MLNRRRIALKKILNRYMGLHFTQHQAPITYEDLADAGLGEAFTQTVKEMLPGWKRKGQEAEPVSIEVRGVAVALDEEISFSCYRFQTLKSPIYTLPLLPRLDRYPKYCQQNTELEADASVSVERALRKRAIHDFMQDMLPAVHHMPLIRLSVFDKFSDGEEQKCLGNILAQDNERFYLAVADFISQRLEETDRIFYESC